MGQCFGVVTNGESGRDQIIQPLRIGDFCVLDAEFLLINRHPVTDFDSAAWAWKREFLIVCVSNRSSNRHELPTGNALETLALCHNADC